MYDHKEIEKKWQDKWAKDQIYKADDNSSKPKYYQLETFPYPSAAGLHVGHPKGYIAEDIHARFMRAQGREVLYTMGWDAFGLPTENYAIKVGKNPKDVAAENIASFKRQVQMFGLSYDWDREINTSSPEYYKWTQWLFLQLYKAGLAYRKKAKVNWCPNDQTVLANEQVIDGHCDRCGTAVTQKEMEQWFFKITDYADRLLDDLESLDWPEATKQMQRNWIGKSEGAEIEFPVAWDEKTNFLILHCKGGSATSDFYPYLKKNLEAAKYEVQIPDLPNAKEPNDVEQTEFVIKNCKINSNTIIIGHSFGAIVAMRIAEKMKVRNLVLAGMPVTGKFLDKKIRPTVTAAAEKGFDFDKIRSNTNVLAFYDINDHLIPEEDGKLLGQAGILVKYVQASNHHFSTAEEPIILDAVLPKIKVFTTRPDTIFGATYMVLAPEHPLVAQITIKEQKAAIEKYLIDTKSKSELERTALDKNKSGEFTGAFAINPATKQRVPIWVADYVLGNYGTGAIMAVPAHDERDYEFAKKYELPIVKVVNDEGDRTLPYLNNGVLIESGKYTKISSATARAQMAADFGTPKIQYRIRDWSISRQRYWGVPIPIIQCEKCGVVPVPEKDLPVVLPDLKDYRPKGMPPLASSEEFMKVKCPSCSGDARREPETLDTFVDSSWYYLRYTDSKNDTQIFANDKAQHWLPVDLYVIGAEHATLHLLYSRFISKFLFDQKFIKNTEPFLKLRHVGLIQGDDGQKMSKSRGNVVNPDEVVGKFGADTVRIYEMFMGPFEDGQPWSEKGVTGSRRFLDKVWRYSQAFQPGADNKHIHKLTKKITTDIENFKFNTAIAAFMEFLNENKDLSRENWETFLVLLAPFAPHITEELWQQLKHTNSIHVQPWPKFDANLTKDEMAEVVIQINGKKKGLVSAPASFNAEELQIFVESSEIYTKLELKGKKINKVIAVPGRLVNFVITE